MNFTCEKCQHVNEINEASLRVSELKGWEKEAGPELVAKLATKTFKKWKGEGFVNLNLSTIFREHLNEKIDSFEVFKKELLPALKKVDENFEILGAIVGPSVMPLAVTDLTKPYALFAFVTIKGEHTQALLDKLDELGMKRAALEGYVGTIGGGTWLDPK